MGDFCGLVANKSLIHVSFDPCGRSHLLSFLYMKTPPSRINRDFLALPPITPAATLIEKWSRRRARWMRKKEWSAKRSERSEIRKALIVMDNLTHPALSLYSVKRRFESKSDRSSLKMLSGRMRDNLASENKEQNKIAVGKGDANTVL